jgi:hypothetical protein
MDLRKEMHMDNAAQLVLIPMDCLCKSDYQHPPFGEVYRPWFERMSRTFAEVCPGSPEDWEDDFRRDRNPEREMALWDELARGYLHFTQGQDWDLGRKKELFQLLLSCLTEGAKYALRRVDLRHLSRARARDIVNHVTQATGGRVQPLVVS